MLSMMQMLLKQNKTKPTKHLLYVARYLDGKTSGSRTKAAQYPYQSHVHIKDF